MFVHFHNVGENYLPYEKMIITDDKWGFIKTTDVLSYQNKTWATLCYPIKKKNHDILGFENQWPRLAPICKLGTSLIPALETLRSATVKLLTSQARSLISFLSKKGATTRLFLSFLGKGYWSLSHPIHGLLYCNFTHLFQLRNSSAGRTGPPGMPYKTRLQADV